VQRVVAAEWQSVDECEGDPGAVQFGDRDRAVECDDRRRVELGELVVEGDDLPPVGVRRGGGRRCGRR
jgi:poly(3-hydroxybutyrate) depolymerase